MDLCVLEDISDDEVFFGEISLKEVKKHIFFNSHRPSLPCPYKNKQENNEESLQIIETSSEPNISTAKYSIESSNSAPNTDWDVKSTDDSFLRLEKMVSDMCMSPKPNDELDNTLEVVEFILNNAPPDSLRIEGRPVPSSGTLKRAEYNAPPIHTGTINDQFNENDNITLKTTPNIPTDVINISTDEKEKTKNLDKEVDGAKLNKLNETPIKCKSVNNHIGNKKTNSVLTPTTKQNEHVFKTPKNTLYTKKQLTSSTKKTPSRLNAYQHIASPVAFYIKNCPQIPLIKDIHLKKKPLTGASSIPKLLKNSTELKVNNKENISLPSVAYKSAKKTKMISLPDTEKLPSSPWAKKLSNSLPKPTVIKHDHREVNSNKKQATTKDEDSFIDLPLKQADLSVCTKKSAFPKLM